MTKLPYLTLLPYKNLPVKDLYRKDLYRLIPRRDNVFRHMYPTNHHPLFSQPVFLGVPLRIAIYRLSSARETNAALPLDSLTLDSEGRTVAATYYVTPSSEGAIYMGVPQ